jgi:hypothetical protein
MKIDRACSNCVCFVRGENEDSLWGQCRIGPGPNSSTVLVPMDVIGAKEGGVVPMTISGWPKVMETDFCVAGFSAIPPLVQ